MAKKYDKWLRNREWLEGKYLDEKLSAREIADIVGCNPSSVRGALKRADIPIRTKSEMYKGTKNPNFGKHPSEETKRKMREGRLIYPELHNEEWLYQRYWGEMLLPKEIAQEIGCSRETVSAALKYFGIDRRTTAEERRIYPALADKEWLWKKYHGEKKSSKEISALVGCSDSTVIFALRQLGISVRSQAEAATGKHHSKKSKEKIAEKKRAQWQDPVFIKKVFDGLNAKPNKPEQLVNHKLQKLFPDEYRYNGNFDCKVTIGGLIPDFVNVNGKKVVIEVFGEPFHDPSKAWMKVGWRRQEFGRKAIYAQLGYKTVVLWVEELRKGNVEQYIRDEFEKEGVI